MSIAIYTREELKILLWENKILKQGEHQLRVSPSKISKHLLDQIYITTHQCRDNINERIYWILNNITEYPLCSECNRQCLPNFYGQVKGYCKVKFCSPKCGAISKKTRNKSADTYEEKTGYRNPWANPEVRNKSADTYEAKTGYRNPLQNPEVREQMVIRYVEKTGYRNPWAGSIKFHHKCFKRWR